MTDDQAPATRGPGPVGPSLSEPTDVGRAIIRADLIGTALFASTAGLEAIFLQRWSEVVGIAVAVGLFLVGCAVFFAAYLTAIQRSRTDEISLVNLFLLVGGTAPRDVMRWLNGLLVAQIAVAIVTSAIRPFTELAFGILVPVFGVAMSGLWGARHGRFPPRIVRSRPPRRGGAPGAERAGGPHRDGEMEQNASHG